ncbi:MAG: Uma2 family endonuclease, partial [Acidimicrobiales bacterium]
GTYHLAPAAHPVHGFVDNALAVLLDPYAKAVGLIATGPFNLGSPDDYRVPDNGYHRQLPRDVWVPTVAVVVEVQSPDDETYAKFGFYAAHDVDEIMVAEPGNHLVRCFRREGDQYAETASSAVLQVETDVLVEAIDWPDPDL